MLICLCVRGASFRACREARFRSLLTQSLSTSARGQAAAARGGRPLEWEAAGHDADGGGDWEWRKNVVVEGVRSRGTGG